MSKIETLNEFFLAIILIKGAIRPYLELWSPVNFDIAD
jgi:hypothetical protein